MSLRSAITAAIRGGKGLPRSTDALITDIDAEFKAVAGKIGPFDPGVDTGAETVTGNITSAVSSVITANLIGSLLVTIPEQPNADYLVLVTFESEGTIALDEDLLPPVIDTKTTTSFVLRVLTGGAATRLVSCSVLIVPVA